MQENSTNSLNGSIANRNLSSEQNETYPLEVPKPALRLIDAIVLIIGIVIGAGIFRTPVVQPPPNWFWLVCLGDGRLVSLLSALFGT